jgi:hypothetical protein
LILGAGASRPYGYPLGVELKNTLLDSPTGFDQALAEVDFKVTEWRAAQSHLRLFQPQSVDEFLVKYGDEYSELVKFAISHRLSAHENIYQHTDPNHQDHWYLRLLIEYLSDDPGLGQGVLRVVTFNYDLSLEAFMFETIKVRHKLTDERARDAVKALDVQHIYGHLGPLQTVHGSGREYGRFRSHAEMKVAAASLSTCFESASTTAVAKAQQHIEESDVVAFLGFGYSDENLKRLDLKAHLRRGTVLIGSEVNCSGTQQRIGPYLPEGMTLQVYGSNNAISVLPSLFAQSL